MRQIVLCLLLLPGCLHAQSEEFNFKNTGDYNNYIMSLMDSVVTKNSEFLSFSVLSEDYDQLEASRKEVIAEIGRRRDSLRQMPPIEGDIQLRDQALSVLDEYQRTFELDFRKVIAMKRKSNDSYQNMAGYFDAEDNAEQKLNTATRRLRTAQREYAKRHEINIVTNSDEEIELKMQKVTAVNNYWRAVFLDYFKVARQYDKMWDALGQQKGSLIERERLDVIKNADQVLPLLKSIPDFSGDHEFRDQTVNIIEYYRSTAENDFKRLVAIFSLKKMDQAGLDEVNGIIRKCNADHERLAYNWNIASQDLFRKNAYQ